MFISLSPFIPKKKIKKKIYPERKYFRDISYLELPFPLFKEGPQWGALLSKEPLLIPKSLDPPENISAYGGERWRKALAFELFKSKIKAEKCDCLIFDDEGDFVNEVEALIPWARSISVFSKKKEEYFNISRGFFSYYGCEIRVNSFLGFKKGYYFSEKPLSLPIDAKRIYSQNIKETMIRIPSNYRGIGIKELSPIRFSEALFKACKKGNIREYLII